MHIESPLLLIGGGTVAWMGMLAFGAVALRRIGSRLRAAGVEMSSAENVHCGNVHGIDETADEADEYNAESVLCPRCGAQNRSEFHRCRECASPIRPGRRAAD